MWTLLTIKQSSIKLKGLNLYTESFLITKELN